MTKFMQYLTAAMVTASAAFGVLDVCRVVLGYQDQIRLSGVIGIFMLGVICGVNMVLFGRKN